VRKEFFVNLGLDLMETPGGEQRGIDEKGVESGSEAEVCGVANAASGFVVVFFVAVDHDLDEEQNDAASQGEGQYSGEFISRIYGRRHSFESHTFKTSPSRATIS
jgi:hypothetical protein